MNRNGLNTNLHEFAEYRFASFLVNERNRQLFCEGAEIQLTPKAFDILLVFLKNPGRLLEKDELIESVWGSKFVEEGNLSRNVSTLRKALGGNAQDHRYLVTIPGHGYRFVAEVEHLGLETQITDDGGLKEGSHLAVDGSPTVNANGFSEYIDGDRHGSAAVETHIDEAQPEVRSWFRRHLVAIVASASLIIIAAASVIVFLPRISGSGSNRPIKSLAVLPFENLSADPSQDYFSDGITEELTQNLTQIGALTVMSRPWTKQLRGDGKMPVEIAKELKVDAIVTGTVQRSEGKVRVSAQLINTASGANIWAQTYVRDQADIVKLESEIARSIVGEIRVKLTPAEEKRLLSARQVDPDAYNEFLLGQAELAKRSEAYYPEAVKHYQRAVEIDPGYALAYARLSESWRHIGIYGNGDLTDVEIPARQAALKAVELDPELSAGHVALYYVKWICDRDWRGAEEEIKRAIDLDPETAQNRWVYSYLLSAEGRNAEAIETIEKAIELGANEPASEWAYGAALHYARRYDEAIMHYDRAIELHVKIPEIYTHRGSSYLQVGRYQDALNDFEKASEGQPRDKVMVAVTYALMGQRQKALQILGTPGFAPSRVALVYVALGEKNKAFEILEKAVEKPGTWIIYLKVDPAFDSLHSDPRWEPLIRRLNFPQI